MIYKNNISKKCKNGVKILNTMNIYEYWILYIFYQGFYYKITIFSQFSKNLCFKLKNEVFFLKT